MKLAIIGSRIFNDYDKLKSFILKNIDIATITSITSGGARGADKLAEKFAKENNIHMRIFKPDWFKYGKAAGFVRNKDIIDYCDAVVAFSVNDSKGTAHSVKLAEKQNKPVYLYSEKTS